MQIKSWNDAMRLPIKIKLRWQRFLHRNAYKHLPVKIDSNDIAIIYRISDMGNVKMNQLPYITKEKCLYNAAKHFSPSTHEWIVEEGTPCDMHMFIDLCLHKCRRLMIPIPSYSTHGERLFLAPFVDWGKEHI